MSAKHLHYGQSSCAGTFHDGISVHAHSRYTNAVIQVVRDSNGNLITANNRMLLNQRDIHNRRRVKIQIRDDNRRIRSMVLGRKNGDGKHIRVRGSS